MAKREDIHTVMVIGSGPIIIGQAAEFDYAGTQACQALREEGFRVVLINSNPATIMTDTDVADRVYVEPLTPEFAEQIIATERPDGLLPTLGGQVGLNLATELMKRGVLERYGVELLGTPIEAIARAEDRERFKQTMEELGEPIAESEIVSTVPDAVAFADTIGYPVIIRPAYTLGGTGGGIAASAGELREIAARGIKSSPINQVLVERSVAGWKEIEYEVMRDSHDNCISVCNMENVDPVGVHTGDSIVVAPSQTLSDREYQLLRSASLRIIRALKIEGGCNVQFALNPVSTEYFVIEVNPRVSRSSALASKATGYPIAKVAAKIAVGLTLDEIKNPVTGTTFAAFEPALDYVVVKIPRWPFDKFGTADRRLGTQMKATGEVMAIDRSFEAALLKAVRSLDTGPGSLFAPQHAVLSIDDLQARIVNADDERLLLVTEALRRGMSIETLHNWSGIDRFFLSKLHNIVELEARLAEEGVLPGLLAAAKKRGITDERIANLTGKTAADIRGARHAHGIVPVYKTVDTCAAEFDATTPYFYSTYELEDEVRRSDGKRVLVLGSGPIRIGQGIEFDYCSVHAVWSLREQGYEAIIINNNPETVSTDFDTADRLYFEPLVLEDVLNVIEAEQPDGVIVQFGGQTALQLVSQLQEAGVRILGTSVDSIDIAEDRARFIKLLRELGIPHPRGMTVTSVEGAARVKEELGFPVLVRPSYVLGGRAMQIVSNQADLETYLASAVTVNPQHPVLIDQYLLGTELEVDAVADGEDVVIPAIMEHVERAGVHSGDSIALCPAQAVSPELTDTVVEYTTRLARALDVRGLLNIQYVVHRGQVYVLEVNPRSSRTIPFVTKVTGVPLVPLATRAIMGQSLRSQGYSSGLSARPGRVGVKLPVFSWAKLNRVDATVGPEMKSTGEVMGFDTELDLALYKAFLAGGFRFPSTGSVLVTLADRDKQEGTEVARLFHQAGYMLYATGGTALHLGENGIPVEVVRKLAEPDDGRLDILELLRQEDVVLVVNTYTLGKQPQRDGFRIRRASAELGIPCVTSLDTAAAVARVLARLGTGPDFTISALGDTVAGGVVGGESS